jgi:hypothetical protein
MMMLPSRAVGDLVREERIRTASKITELRCARAHRDEDENPEGRRPGKCRERDCRGWSFEIKLRKPTTNQYCQILFQSL